MGEVVTNDTCKKCDCIGGAVWTNDPKGGTEPIEERCPCPCHMTEQERYEEDQDERLHAKQQDGHK